MYKGDNFYVQNATKGVEFLSFGAWNLSQYIVDQWKNYFLNITNESSARVLFSIQLNQVPRGMCLRQRFCSFQMLFHFNRTDINPKQDLECYLSLPILHITSMLSSLIHSLLTYLWHALYLYEIVWNCGERS